MTYQVGEAKGYKNIRVLQRFYRPGQAPMVPETTTDDEGLVYLEVLV